MAAFLTDLFNSIFTPGPTPSLLLATNASFACLQLLLAILLIATYSIHFLILSCLSGGLWWAINWFANELQAAKAKEEKSEQIRAYNRKRQLSPGIPVVAGDDTETETDTAPSFSSSPPLPPPPSSSQSRATASGRLQVDDLKKRSSTGGGTEASTEDEWEKVEEEKDR
jgi:hypothetical protein